MVGFFFTEVEGPLDGVPPTERVTRCPGVSVVDKLPTTGTSASCLEIGVVDSLSFTNDNDSGDDDSDL